VNPRIIDGTPFEHLTEWQRHARELAAEPVRWMPWNYRDKLAQNA
jgi:hypothetical protein